MDITYLKEFVVLAEVKNYFNAAEALFISQSSLSKHIKAIEKELGIALFTRSTRHVALTDAGLMFLPYARHIVNLYQSATINLEDARESYATRTLNIGSIPVMSPYGITEVLYRFSRENPWIKVNLIEGDEKHLKSMLQRGEIELAFVREGDATVDDAFLRTSFASDTMVAVLPPNHPLASRSELALEELAGSTFLFVRQGSLIYDMAVEACSAAGFAPLVMYTGSRAQNIVDLVSRGAGVSLLMKRAVSDLGANVSLVPITPTIRTNICLYAMRGGELSREARAFLEFVPLLKSGTLASETLATRPITDQASDEDGGEAI